MIKRLLFFIILFICVGFKAFSEDLPKNSKTKTIIVSGKVLDKSTNENLAGVKIICQNGSQINYSNLDGRFFIYIETMNENETLEFSQIGYSSKTIDLKEIQDNSSILFVDLVSE